LPPRFLRTQEAAEFLGISLRTLEKHRTFGTGPTDRKLGARVVYAVDDLKDWLATEARKFPRTKARTGSRPAPHTTPDKRGER
jgi:predicted DNA-binding transcriptional regulator AlpA